jgi:hypothetical protein
MKWRHIEQMVVRISFSLLLLFCNLCKSQHVAWLSLRWKKSFFVALFCKKMMFPLQARLAYFHDSCAHVILPAFDCRVYRTPTLELISFICKCSLHNQCKHGVIQKYPTTCATLRVNLAFANESLFGNFWLQSDHFQGYTIIEWINVKINIKFTL